MLVVQQFNEKIMRGHMMSLPLHTCNGFASPADPVCHMYYEVFEFCCMTVYHTGRLAWRRRCLPALQLRWWCAENKPSTLRCQGPICFSQQLG